MNEIIKYDDYAEMIIYEKQGNEKCRTLIDLDDIDKVKDYNWHSNGIDYILTNKTKSHPKLYLHRFIMNAPKDMEVDHINHNPLDNRKCNLRICTHKQNLRNQSINKNNTSGYPGVSWYKKYKKWKVRIISNGKDIHLGYYDDLEEAIKVRKQAEIEYFGEYRRGDK